MKKTNVIGILFACCLTTGVAHATIQKGFFVSDISVPGTYPNCSVGNTATATIVDEYAWGTPGPILTTEANNCWNVSSNYSAFDQWRAPLSNYPVWPVPGNHDYYTSGSGTRSRTPDAFTTYFGAPYRAAPTYGIVDSMTTNDWLVLGLDSELTDDSNAPSKMADQVAWLERTLSERSQRCVLVYAHRPAYSNARKHNPGKDPNGRLDARLTEKLKTYHADLLFSGHEHLSERFSWDPSIGLIQIVAGTGGTTLDNTSPFLASNEANYVSDPPTVFRATGEHGVLRFYLWDDGLSPSMENHAGFAVEFISATQHRILDDTGFVDCNGYYF